ncbi:hypothetical protein SALBM311S_04767 [Streptomyces alboniger]
MNTERPDNDDADGSLEERGAGGSTEEQGAAETKGAAAEASDAGQSSGADSVEGGTDEAGARAAGTAGTGPAGTEEAGAEEAGAEKAGAEKAGAEKVGASAAGTDVACAKEADARTDGASAAGANAAGPGEAHAGEAGASAAGAGEAGASPVGAEGARAEEAGVGAAHAEEAEAEKAGAEKAGAGVARPDDAGLDKAGLDDAGLDKARPDDARADEAGTEGPASAPSPVPPSPTPFPMPRSSGVMTPRRAAALSARVGTGRPPSSSPSPPPCCWSGAVGRTSPRRPPTDPRARAGVRRPGRPVTALPRLRSGRLLRGRRRYDGIAPGEPNPYGVTYRADGTLPDGPGSAPVYRTRAANEGGRPHWPGPSESTGSPWPRGAWTVGAKDSMGPSLQVNRQAPGTWTFHRYSPGTDNCAGAAERGARVRPPHGHRRLRHSGTDEGPARSALRLFHRHPGEGDAHRRQGRVRAGPAHRGRTAGAGALLAVRRTGGRRAERLHGDVSGGRPGVRDLAHTVGAAERAVRTGRPADGRTGSAERPGGRLHGRGAGADRAASRAVCAPTTR